MAMLTKYFEAIIERYSRYENLDTAKVITDVINGLTFRG